MRNKMRSKMGNKKRAYIFLAVFLAVMVFIEILFAHPHYHMPWNEIHGADIFIGFAGAWILIFLAKICMTRLLQRDEDYYEKTAARGGEADE